MSDDVSRRTEAMRRAGRGVSLLDQIVEARQHEREAHNRAEVQRAEQLLTERNALREERDRLLDRLVKMNECVRAYVAYAGDLRPGWLEEEVAATDAVLSAGRGDDG